MNELPPIETDGVSKKVSWPAIALAILGAVLTILSPVVKGADPLGEIGLSLLGAAGVTGGLGYSAPAAHVKGASRSR